MGTPRIAEIRRFEWDDFIQALQEEIDPAPVSQVVIYVGPEAPTPSAAAIVEELTKLMADQGIETRLVTSA